MKPVAALTKVRGITAMLENKANWVAVKFLLVDFAI